MEGNLPYILAYKTKNFGQNINVLFTIRLIRGSLKKHILEDLNNGPLIKKNI